MYMYYKYAPYGSKFVVLSYADNCVYWYTSEEPVKFFVDTLVKIFNVNFLGYVSWFLSIRISQFNDHYIPVDHYRYTIFAIANHLDTDTI